MVSHIAASSSSANSNGCGIADGYSKISNGCFKGLKGRYVFYVTKLSTLTNQTPKIFNLEFNLPFSFSSGLGTRINPNSQTTSNVNLYFGKNYLTSSEYSSGSSTSIADPAQANKIPVTIDDTLTMIASSSSANQDFQ